MSGRIRIVALGVVCLAAGLVVSQSAVSGPSTPTGLSFVGDARPASSQGQLDFGRWGGGSSEKDKAPRVQPRERARQVLNVAPMDLAALVPDPDNPSGPKIQMIDAVRKSLKKAANADPALAKRLEKIASQVPVALRGKDLHPLEYLEYVKTLTDKDAKFISPPPNQIKIVDQNEIERRLAAGEKAFDNFYRIQKTTVVTHTLTPIFQTATVYYPG
jgi:hypothetical protein